MGVKVYQVLDCTGKSRKWVGVKVYGSDQVMHLTRFTFGNVLISNNGIGKKEGAVVLTISDQSWKHAVKCGIVMRVDKSI
jgi:hypothetical protein